MAECIMVACDLHDKTMLLKVAQGRQAAETMSLRNTSDGRRRLIAHLQKQAQAAGAARVVFAYEASGQGVWAARRIDGGRFRVSRAGADQDDPLAAAAAS
jgi:hypothetical protein